MKIIPKPENITMLEGNFTFSNSTQIVGLDEFLTNDLRKFVDLKDGEKNSCVFTVAQIDEDYRIEIGENIYVVANSNESIFHAVQTIKLLILEYYKNEYSYIPCCIIDDNYKYEYRGFMLDICRHFYPISTIKKIIDAISLFKMNKLHLHLSDDQGFRIQLNRFPLLTDIGSIRKGTRGDGKPVSGFYTQSDIVDLVKYAKERYIEIIPEIDLPGHTSALIASYPDLHCKGKEIEVEEYFGIKENVVCAGKESTYQFLEDVLGEIAKLFPSKCIHIGGDEAPKTQWMECDDCNETIKKNGLKTYMDLQSYFTNRIIKYLKSIGKTPIVWNEAYHDGQLDKAATIQFWADGSKAQNVKNALKEGYKLIYSNNKYCYLDHPYSSLPIKNTFKAIKEMKSLEQVGNVFGIETPLWTEWIDDEDKLLKMAFPRTLAIAELGWSVAPRDYNEFKDRIDNGLDALFVLDIASASKKQANPNIVSSFFGNLKFYGKMIDKELPRTIRNFRYIKK